jgi:hypothetical protein
MLNRLRILWLTPFVILLVAGSSRTFTIARKAVVGSEVTERTLSVWWYIVGSTYLTLFICSSVFVLLFFQVLKRRVPSYLKIFCLMTVFAIWMLLALATITSDPVAVSALSNIGLERLHYLLWATGMVLWIPFFYALFRTVDESRQSAGDSVLG